MRRDPRPMSHCCIIIVFFFLFISLLHLFESVPLDTGDFFEDSFSSFSYVLLFPCSRFLM